MKKTLLFALVLLVLMPSCHKKGVALFSGDYSYKMSGTVVFERSDNSFLSPIEFNITNEIGNMNISTASRKDGTVMVVMNAVDGEVSTTEAYCSGTEISLDGFQRILRLTNIAQGVNTNCRVEMQAKGTMYDDNTIIFDVNFSGERTYLGIDYTIKGDDIVMVAYRND